MLDRLLVFHSLLSVLHTFCCQLPLLQPRESFKTAGFKEQSNAICVSMDCHEEDQDNASCAIVYCRHRVTHGRQLFRLQLLTKFPVNNLFIKVQFTRWISNLPDQTLLGSSSPPPPTCNIQRIVFPRAPAKLWPPNRQ